MTCQKGRHVRPETPLACEILTGLSLESTTEAGQGMSWRFVFPFNHSGFRNKRLPSRKPMGLLHRDEVSLAVS
jgi:hypothetical protein